MFDVCERLVPILCHCCSYYIAFGVGMKNCALQYEHSLNLFGVFWKGRTSSIFWKFTIWYYSSFFPFNTSLCEQPSLLCPRSLPLGTFRQESRRFFWRNVASGEERGEPRRLFSQAFLLHTPQRLTVKPGQVCVPPKIPLMNRLFEMNPWVVATTSLNFIRLLRVVITPSATSELTGR